LGVELKKQEEIDLFVKPSPNSTCSDPNSLIMSLKTAQLTQQIQDLQQFVASRINQDATYADIAEKLERVSTALNQGKLNLQICGRSPILTESLEDLLSRSQGLEAFYQIQIAPISDRTSTKPALPPAVLVAQTHDRHFSHISPYSLPTDRKTTLGRRPGNDILLPDDCSLVSGQHLEIIPPTTADGNWTISDLNSTNGTFVNGQAVRGSEQVLRSGDRIVLGATDSDDRAPEFLFECESDVDLEANPLERAIADADVFCLAIDPSQSLSEAEKELIKQASQSQVAQINLVADMPPESQGNSDIINNIKNIEEWLKNYKAQLVCLSLRSSYSQEHDATVLAVDKQDELSEFCHQLEQFGQNQLEEILIQRSTQGAIAQLARIEAIGDRQQAQLRQEIAATEATLQVSETKDLKEQLKKEIRTATQEKDALFKEIKHELSEFKNNLISENLKIGLPYKIKQFVDSLSHIVTNKNQQTHIYFHLPVDPSQPKPKKKPPELSDRIHPEITQFCQDHLNYSAAHEWNRICNEYGNGGLNQLFQKTGDRFNALVPNLNLPSTDYQPQQVLDIQKIFLHSSVAYPWETHYKTVPLMSYLFKNIKGQIMSVMMLIGLFGGGAGVLGDSKLFIIWALCPIILIFLISSYQGDKREELEKQMNTFKGNRCKEYQSIGKELVNKMLQLIGLVLDSEEQKFKKILEIIEEHTTDYTIGAKNTLTQLKAKEMELKKERLELEKLKRF